MKNIIKYVCASICVLCISFLISIPIVNNYTAKETAEYLQSIPLPEKTKYIESIFGAGKYVGNGNGMQYLGCILLKSELGLEELREYYLTYAMDEWDCLVEEQHGHNVEVIDRGGLSFHTQMDNGNYYIVYSWGSGIELYAQLDIRGH